MLALFCQECEHWDREQNDFGKECKDCKGFSKYKVYILPYTTTCEPKVTHSVMYYPEDNRIDFE